MAGNLFTIFVFWKHRNRLKRTCFLLINLAIADLLVGFTEPIVLGTIEIPRHLDGPNITGISGNVLLVFQATFSFASVFFLVLIALERAIALIWPLRHRAANTKGYIFSITFTWIAGVSVGVLNMLAVHGILDIIHWTAGFGSTMVLCLIIVCITYLAIRTRLKRRVPVLDAAHNRRIAAEQNAKLSRTLFLVITASFIFWFPSIIVCGTHLICSECVSVLVFHVFNLFRLGNCLVNPIIYSFRIPMFREKIKQTKLCKQ